MTVKPSNLDDDLKNLLHGADQVVPFVTSALEEAAKKKG